MTNYLCSVALLRRGLADRIFSFCLLVFALIGIVARRVFWFALVFAGALIFFLTAW